MRPAVNAISHRDHIAVRSVSVCGRRARMTRAEWMVMCSVDWQLDGPCQYNVAEIRVNADRGDTVPAASIWDQPRMSSPTLEGILELEVDYNLPPLRNHYIWFFFVSIGLSSTCGHRPNVMVTAILPLVLSCATIVSSHRTTRKGGISFSPTGLLFLAGVSLSLSVQHERHLPTQNQNSNYCAAVKRVVKRRRLISYQTVALCLLEKKKMNICSKGSCKMHRCR